MDIGPLVIAHAQAAKLIQPGKRALDDPPPSAQSTAVFRSADGEQREDVADPKTAPDCLRVVCTVAQQAVGTATRASSLSLKCWNRIDERQRFLRIMSVGTGQAKRERHALAVANQMTLGSAFGPISGIWTGLVAPAHRTDGTTVHDRPRPIDLVAASEPFQQRKVDQIAHPHQLPIAQTPPARHTKISTTEKYLNVKTDYLHELNERVPLTLVKR